LPSARHVRVREIPLAVVMVTLTVVTLWSLGQAIVVDEELAGTGPTIALGGLTDKQRDVQSGGVPILSSIPLLGGLFGRQARNTTETELFIFLTPRVIRTDEDAERLTDPMRKRADQVKP
jgi:general secretion pathway protein D